MQWHKIHDFFHGWGFREHIPDNEIVEQIIDERCRVVRHKQQERMIWAKDAHRLLRVEIFKIPEDELESIHTKLEPLIQKELEERREYYRLNPIQFKTISIPKINKPFPKLVPHENEVSEEFDRIMKEFRAAMDESKELNTEANG